MIFEQPVILVDGDVVMAFGSAVEVDVYFDLDTADWTIQLPAFLEDAAASDAEPVTVMGPCGRLIHGRPLHVAVCPYAEEIHSIRQLAWATSAERLADHVARALADA